MRIQFDRAQRYPIHRECSPGDVSVLRSSLQYCDFVAIDDNGELGATVWVDGRLLPKGDLDCAYEAVKRIVDTCLSTHAVQT